MAEKNTKEKIEQLATEKPEPVRRTIDENDKVIGFRIIHDRLIHLWILDKRTSTVRRVEYQADDFDGLSLIRLDVAMSGIELI
jgi:hypothetical protein